MWLAPHGFPSASMGEYMKIKIMAVDDDPLDLGLLKTTLEPYGYEVLAVGDSRDALKLLEIEKVDGLFVDVHMPCLDGIELTQMVRRLKLGREPACRSESWTTVKPSRSGDSPGSRSSRSIVRSHCAS